MAVFQIIYFTFVRQVHSFPCVVSFPLLFAWLFPIATGSRFIKIGKCGVKTEKK